MKTHSPQTAGIGMSGLVSPDLTPLNEWRKRVIDNLKAYIELYVEDTNHLPSEKDFTELCWAALHNVVKP
jgi:hypothetical protein